MPAYTFYRPDAVTRTGVPAPYGIRFVDPVEVARHTIDPFILGIRPMGPTVAPRPTATMVAQAAGKLASEISNGKSVKVAADGVVRVVSPAEMKQPAQAPESGVVGQVMAAARSLLAGRPVLVRAAGSLPAIARPSEALIAKATAESAAAPAAAITAAPLVPQTSAQPQTAGLWAATYAGRAALAAMNRVVR